MVPWQATKSRQPFKTARHHPALGSSTKTFFASGNFTICRSIPLSWAAWRACSPVWPLSAQAISTECPVALCTCLGPLLFIGWSDIHGQEMAQSIHSHMDLAAAPALAAVIARTWATLATGLQGATIHHHVAGVGCREAPFFIADVGWVRLAGHGRTLLGPPTAVSEVHNMLQALYCE